MQEQDPYVFLFFYWLFCLGAWGARYALCITKNSALSTEGKHLPEGAGGSGRFLFTPRYCMSALFSLRGVKCQDKFKCQASREVCQSRGEHPPWSNNEPLQDQMSERCVALSCACRTQYFREPQGPRCTSFTLRDQRSQDFTKLPSKVLPCCSWLSSARLPGDNNTD